jgi:hypothetical protein
MLAHERWRMPWTAPDDHGRPRTANRSLAYESPVIAGLDNTVGLSHGRHHPIRGALNFRGNSARETGGFGLKIGHREMLAVPA